MKKTVSVVSKTPQKAQKSPISKLKPKNKALQSRKKPAKKRSGTYNPLGGRPPKYETVEELEKIIDVYFLSCWIQKVDMFGNPIFLKDKKGKKTNKKVMFQFKPYTVTGLAVTLGV